MYSIILGLCTLPSTHCSLSIKAQKIVEGQSIISALITDAQSNEILPYATIRSMHTGKGTLSNSDGVFIMRTAPDDTLTISFIGYERLTLPANNIPKRILMKPMSTELVEVKVTPIPVNDILKKLITSLDREFSLQEDSTAIYFFRTVTVLNDSIDEMLEGFYTARSAVNIREPSIISGQTKINGLFSQKALKRTNVHVTFGLGPQIHGINFWNSLTSPLKDTLVVFSRYDINAQSLYDETGRHIYKISLLDKNFKKETEEENLLNQKKTEKKDRKSRWKTIRNEEPQENPQEQNRKRVLQGTVYIDAETLRLLHFDGEMLGYYQTLNYRREPAKMELHVEYDHTRDFTEVSYISIEGGNASLNYHTLLFNVDYNTIQQEHEEIGDNMVDAINSAGYEHSLWEIYDIVGRTTKEEEIAKRERIKSASSDNNE